MGAYQAGGGVLRHAGDPVKRYFKMCIESLWEWDTDTRTAHWVNATTGKRECDSQFVLDEVMRNHNGTSREVFPKWATPEHLRLPEGL